METMYVVETETVTWGPFKNKDMAIRWIAEVLLPGRSKGTFALSPLINPITKE